jgi:hypothetical protein
MPNRILPDPKQVFDAPRVGDVHLMVQAVDVLFTLCQLSGQGCTSFAARSCFLRQQDF